MHDDKIKLLFITRKFPPMVGGMENLSYGLATEFKKQVNTTIISWGKSQKYLPFFLPYAFIKALYTIPTKHITHIHLGDALLSPIGLLLKKLFGIKTTVTVMGLDITYRLSIYQLIIPRSVAQLDKIICISSATKNQCIKHGIPNEKCIVIPPGVYPADFIVQADRKDLENIIHRKIQWKKVLISVGRLVKRKGVSWFIENVLPKLSDKYIYVVIGDGPERVLIENLIKSLRLESKVVLLGKISDSDLKTIYNTADLFIMPNIKVEGDIEGFGIVAIEAASAGLPIVASNIEGVSDAVLPYKTGMLYPANNSDIMIHTLKTFDINKESIKRAASRKFGWKKIAGQYIAEISNL